MQRFAYTARDAEGRTQRGVREALSELALVEGLRADDLLATDIRPAPAAGATASGRGPGLLGWLPPRSLDVEIGLQQLAFMLRSGMALLAALETAAAQSRRASMARTWRRVAQRIQEGSSFNEAMADHRCFPVVTTLVAVGEEAGELDRVLLRAAEGLERRRTLRTNLLTALTYPSIVVLMAFAVVGYLLLGLIPKLRTFLATFHRKLPPITQSLVDTSAWLQQHALVLALVAAGIVVGVVLLRSWGPGRLVLDRGTLRVPVFGGLLRLSATAAFSRTMSLLVDSGVRLTDALRVAMPLHANRWIASRIAAARQGVLHGNSLADSLAQGGVFLPMLPSMVAVGEASGELGETLGEVATFHESRLGVLIRRWSSFFEPVVMLVVGGIVGFVYLAFFVAIYSIAGSR